MFIQPGKPNQNAFVERFNRRFRDEALSANLFISVDQAQDAEEVWAKDYNDFRPIESQGDVAPMEFMPRKFLVLNFLLDRGVNAFKYCFFIKKILLE
jgi:putative transposase